MRRKLFFIALYAILAVLILFGGALESFLAGADYKIIRATSVAITPDWQTIVPKKPLEVSRRTQSIWLQVGEPFKLVDSCWCIGLPDGSFAKPEVELVGVNGTVYPFKFVSFCNSFRYKAWMLSCDFDNLPADQKFSAVRIRCNRSVVVSRIIWFCEDPK